MLKGRPRAAVFCSSSSTLSPIYFSEMENLARGLVRNGWDVVYGGSNLGLMGHLARVVRAEGGEIAGVISKSLNRPEIVEKSISDLIVVEHLADHKRLMLEMSDVAIAFPGGLGTLDELTEVLALKQIGETDIPLVLANILDFWEPLLEWFAIQEQAGFLPPKYDQFFTCLDNTQEVIDYLQSLRRGL